MKIHLTDRSRLMIMAVVVAVTLMTIMISAVVYVPRHYLEKLDWKWFRFSLITAAFIAYSLKTYWGNSGTDGTFSAH